MDRRHPLVAGGDRRERGERRAAFATFRRIHRRRAARHGAGDRGPAAYYAPPIAPAFFSAFQAGRASIWLLLQDRGAHGRPTREQRFAEELRQRYPEVRIRDASPILLAMGEIKSDAELTLIQRAVDVTVEAQNRAST